MNSETFVRAMMELRFREVLRPDDYARLNHDTIGEALDRGSDHFLIGFELRGWSTRVVWAVIKVVRLGVQDDADLPEDIREGAAKEAFDFQLHGFDFASGPKGGNPVAAGPSDYRGIPAIVVPFPGLVSWKELQRTSERLMH